MTFDAFLEEANEEELTEALLSHITEMERRTQLLDLRKNIPPVFTPLFQSARYKGAYGGRGSAKSWTFAAMVLLRAIETHGLRVVCVREVQKSLGQSVKRLLEDTIQRYDLGSRFRVLVNHIETPGDGVIIFQGMQDHTAESIKSLEGFDIAWVEEAQALSARSLELLRPTLRKPNSELWFSWNPRRASDPVDNFFRSGEQPPNSVLVKANFRDNPYLPKVLQDELDWDQRRDIEKFNHIWLGEYERHSEARVFKNWRVEEFETPVNAQFVLGGDWGFSIDPTVLFRGFVVDRRLYIDHEVYKVGCEIDHTPALFDSLACKKSHIHDYTYVATGQPNPGQCDCFARKWPIIADSARPETISYMQRHGYPRITGARKGQGSVEEGINFLKNYDIIVHPRCPHAVDELTMYSYKTHPLTGEIIPVLDDKKNHVIDAIRYAAESLRRDLDGFVVW